VNKQDTEQNLYNKELHNFVSEDRHFIHGNPCTISVLKVTVMQMFHGYIYFFKLLFCYCSMLFYYSRLVQ